MRAVIIFLTEEGMEGNDSMASQITSYYFCFEKKYLYIASKEGKQLKSRKWHCINGTIQFFKLQLEVTGLILHLYIYYVHHIFRYVTQFFLPNNLK